MTAMARVAVPVRNLAGVFVKGCIGHPVQSIVDTPMASVHADDTGGDWRANASLGYRQLPRADPAVGFFGVVVLGVV